MPDPLDETRTLRRRLRDVEDALESGVDDARGCCACVVGKTIAMAVYPTAAAAYYALQAVRVTGRIAEGTAPTLTAATNKFFALNLGATIPPSGTYVVAMHAGGRWTFRYG